MRATALPLLVAIGMLLPSAAGQDQRADATFSTPEAAVTHYLDGVARHDVGHILQACAVDEVAAGFAFDLQVERLGGVMILGEILSPAQSPFFVELNRAKVSARILSQVNLLTLSLLSSEEVSPAPIFPVDPDRVARLMMELDPERLSAVELERIDPPNEALMATPRYLENTTRAAVVYGADEQTERVALLSFEGRHLLVGFTLLRYGDSWKVGSQSSPLGRTEASGPALETTVEEYEALITGN